MATKARTEKPSAVPSYPVKTFFVSMLTRDIELSDAILDLLDNCVDGAIRSRTKKQEQEDSLDGYWAKIKFDVNKFTIEDNCGGIPWELAMNYAFLLGRPEGINASQGMIGVVGIGMKRAIFKIGRECHVQSNHKEDSFLVTIPKKWFDDDKTWEPFEVRHEAPGTSYGTTIEITRIRNEVKEHLDSGSSFRTLFHSMVSEAYSYLIEKGFKVTINDIEVKPKYLKLYVENPESRKEKGELIRPYLYKGKVGPVEVFMAVGYRSPIMTEDEARDASFAAKDAGWTIICNDRVVLSNDRTIKTGWGIGDVPHFHNQFSCIAGIVEFSSTDMSKLPVTTTKRGIDVGTDLYQQIRQRMQEGVRLFTRNTNNWKSFEKDLKERFKKTDMMDLRALKKYVKGLPMAPLRGNGAGSQYKPSLPVKKKETTTQRITFVREKRDIGIVGRYISDQSLSANEVGEACFDKLLREAKR